MVIVDDGRCDIDSAPLNLAELASLMAGGKAATIAETGVLMTLFRGQPVCR